MESQADKTSNALTASILDCHGHEFEMVCRETGNGEYWWFVVGEAFQTLIPSASIYGDDLEEAQSEFELFFGVIHKQSFRVRASWYQYNNTF